MGCRDGDVLMKLKVGLGDWGCTASGFQYTAWTNGATLRMSSLLIRTARWGTTPWARKQNVSQVSIVVLRQTTCGVIKVLDTRQNQSSNKGSAHKGQLTYTIALPSYKGRFKGTKFSMQLDVDKGITSNMREDSPWTISSTASHTIPSVSTWTTPNFLKGW